MHCHNCVEGNECTKQKFVQLLHSGCIVKFQTKYSIKYTYICIMRKQNYSTIFIRTMTKMSVMCLIKIHQLFSFLIFESYELYDLSVGHFQAVQCLSKTISHSY